MRAAARRWDRNANSSKAEHARTLLETTDLPVARIAAACGFGDPVALRKHFSTYLGMSPLAYRRAHHAPEPRGAATGT